MPIFSGFRQLFTGRKPVELSVDQSGHTEPDQTAQELAPELAAGLAAGLAPASASSPALDPVLALEVAGGVHCVALITL